MLQTKDPAQLSAEAAAEAAAAEKRAECIEACARAAHEANVAYCLAIGDTSQVSWNEAPDWQRESCRKGVEGVLAGNGPEASHNAWLVEKHAQGWTYGVVKDPVKKTHPCFLPYDKLSEADRQKDAIFVAVVSAVARALGIPPRVLRSGGTLRSAG